MTNSQLFEFLALAALCQMLVCEGERATDLARQLPDSSCLLQAQNFERSLQIIAQIQEISPKYQSASSSQAPEFEGLQKLALRFARLSIGVASDDCHCWHN